MGAGVVVLCVWVERGAAVVYHGGSVAAFSEVQMSATTFCFLAAAVVHSR